MSGNPLFISILSSPISQPLTSRRHTQHASRLFRQSKVTSFPREEGGNIAIISTYSIVELADLIINNLPILYSQRRSVGIFLKLTTFSYILYFIIKSCCSHQKPPHSRKALDYQIFISSVCPCLKVTSALSS